ncbi:MAG: carbohydrate ABC transporter permease [Bacillota bacterium]|nr:carbohydrate ABC transporter permease [Bacillota bacterium]
MAAEQKEYVTSLARYNRIKPLTNAIFTIYFIVFAIVCVAPVIFTAIISVSAEESIRINGYSFTPSQFSMDAYNYLWTNREPISMAFFNSIFNTLVGVVLGLFLTSSMGYALSRKEYVLRRFFTLFIFIPMLFGGGLVASYLINTQLLMLKNTRWALILPLCVSSFNIVIMRTFFQTGTPDAILESAEIDGASQYRIYFGIVIPISKPVFATIGLFLTFAFWNDWFQASLYLSSDHFKLFPLQYVLVSIQKNLDFMVKNQQYLSTAGGTANLPAESSRMAMVMVIVLPIAMAYPFFQKYFISGLTIGAVKG